MGSVEVKDLLFLPNNLGNWDSGEVLWAADDLRPGQVQGGLTWPFDQGMPCGWFRVRSGGEPMWGRGWLSPWHLDVHCQDGG